MSTGPDDPLGPEADRQAEQPCGDGVAGDPVIGPLTPGDLVAVIPELYADLRRLAQARLGDLPPGQTLNAPALVNEAFVRLAARASREAAPVPTDGEPHAPDRVHVFMAAARAIHDVLVEHARAKARLKRGGGWRRIDADSLVLAAEAPPEELLALRDVLERLETTDPEMQRMVMLRFFAGLTAAQTAELMGMPLRTFERRWRFARSILRRELSGDGEGSADGAVSP